MLRHGLTHAQSERLGVLVGVARRKRHEDVQPALSRRLRDAWNAQPVEHPLQDLRDLYRLIDAASLGGIEIEHHPVRHGQALPPRVPHVDFERRPLREPAERVRAVRDEVADGTALRLRGRLRDGHPVFRVLPDVLPEPRRLRDALVPVDEDEGPIRQSAEHRLGNGLVVRGDVALGNLLLRIEDAVGIRQLDLRARRCRFRRRGFGRGLPRGSGGGRRRRRLDGLLAHALHRRLVRAQALECRVAQLAVRRPLGELDFPHQPRLHPVRRAQPRRAACL